MLCKGASGITKIASSAPERAGAAGGSIALDGAAGGSIALAGVGINARASGFEDFFGFFSNFVNFSLQFRNNFWFRTKIDFYQTLECQ